jgi:3-deoxy-manno-octulosonate cytidylyltransferase (CMP-KDO synthetase)
LNSPVLGVIPARLGSTRLRNKPLQPILGRPLLEWVWSRVRAFGVLDRVVVATDDTEILALCTRLGAEAYLTDPAHPSGTDRVAEIALRPDFRAFPVIVNVQGDEPLLDPGHLQGAVTAVTEGAWAIGTCAAPLRDPTLLLDPSVVKVARAQSGRALYFSRAAIPHWRDGVPPADSWVGPLFLRHIGIYAYRREALLRWVSLPPSPLEEVERLEQLRPLEAGIDIGVALVDQASPGVDTPDDILTVETLLQRAKGALPPVTTP